MKGPLALVLVLVVCVPVFWVLVRLARAYAGMVRAWAVEHGVDHRSSTFALLAVVLMPVVLVGAGAVFLWRLGRGRREERELQRFSAALNKSFEPAMLARQADDANEPSTFITCCECHRPLPKWTESYPAATLELLFCSECESK